MANQFLDPSSPAVAAIINEKAGIKPMEEGKLFCEIPSVDSLCCILGLVFPDSATEFQKATLTLAHLYASIRDYVLKGVDIPQNLIEIADHLNSISYEQRTKQR